MRKYIYISFILISLLFSCSKDSAIFIPDQVYTINHEVLFNKLVGPTTTYSIELNPTEPFILNASNGIVVEIPMESLMDTNGNLAEGKISVELNNIGNNATSMLASPSMVANSSVFSSIRMIQIEFSQNGKSLKFAKPIYIYINGIEDAVENNYYSFEGTNSSDNVFNWSVNQSLGLLKWDNWQINNGSGLVEFVGFRIPIRSGSSWYSIGNHLNEGSPLQDICVELPSNFNSHNTLAYFLSEDKRTSIRLVDYDSANNQFCLMQKHLEDGLKGRLIVLSDLGNDDFYIGQTLSTVGIGVGQKIPQKKTLEEIKAILNSL